MLKLSIIVPIYNAEKYLSKCLNSILAQSLKDWECFLIDDGSTDNSGRICDNFALNDKRFKVIHKQNEGPALSRNTGISLATGEWIGFLDADDWIEPNRFKNAIEQGDLKNANIVQTKINVWKDGKIKHVWGLPEDKLYKYEEHEILSNYKCDIGHCWDKIYKTSLLRDNKIFFEDCDLFEDLIFNVKAYVYSKSILGVSDRSYNYLIHNDSLSHVKITPKRKLEVINVVENLIRGLKIPLADKNFFRGFFEKAINNKCADMIDYVFPFVDSSDPEWQIIFNKYSPSKTNSSTNGKERYQSSLELLKYKFRSMEKWMPDFGVVHLIVMSESQLPDWLDTSKIHVVYHKDFIPEKFLPTFNSCTIEMFLHNIFGVSEQFVYSNDDVYPNYKLVPKFFFENGKLKSDFHVRKLYRKNDLNQVWVKIPMKSIGLAAQDTPEYKNKFVKGDTFWELQHIGKPMFRSVNKKVYELYKKEIEDSITPFRNEKNINQYIFTSYALFHDLGTFSTFRYELVFIEDYNMDKICNLIEEPVWTDRTRVICCNDCSKTTTENYKRMCESFNKIYPNKSKYEV